MNDSTKDELDPIEIGKVRGRIDVAAKQVETIETLIQNAEKITASIETKIKEIREETAKLTIAPPDPNLAFGHFRRLPFWAAVISIILLCLSVYCAYYIRSHNWPAASRELWGRWIVGAWALGPPLFFWADWIWGTRDMKGEELENVKYSQEVGRNIWLAVVVVIAAIFGIKWPVE
jgi:hypothetical protein